jgi:hypothetical protein
MQNSNSKIITSYLIVIIATVAGYFLMKHAPSVSTENTIEAIQLEEGIVPPFPATQELNPETGKIDFMGHYISSSTPKNFVMEEQGPSAGKNHCALWEYIKMYDSTLPKITTEADGPLVPPTIEVLVHERDLCGGSAQPLPDEYKDTIATLVSLGVSEGDARAMIVSLPARDSVERKDYGDSCKNVSVEKVGEGFAIYADDCIVGPAFPMFYLVIEPIGDALIELQGISGYYDKETLLEISNSIRYN